MILGLAAILGAFVGGLVGWTLRGRSLAALELDRQREHERLRVSVIPVLERRATALAIPKERRSDDAVEGAVEVASAIQAAEEKLVLPFTDTLEISRTELARAQRE